MTPLRVTLLVIGLPAWLLATPPGDWSPTLTTTVAWNNNASNASRSADIVSAFQLRADGNVTHRLSLGSSDALFLGGRLAVEAWPRFDGLDRASLGPRLAWQHKFGLGALAPTFSVELAGDAIAARESDRAGFACGVTFAWRKRLDEATRVSLIHERSRHDARADVFDRTGSETSLEFTRDLDEHWQLAVAARWREGDVLSYAAPPRPDLVSLAKVRVPVTTFDRAFVAYSLGAHTLTGALALSRTLDPATALIFGYEWRDTERGPLRYVNHLVSASLVRQF